MQTQLAQNVNTTRDDTIDRFLAASGWGRGERRKLAGDASFRRYERIVESDRTAVLMDAPPGKEDVRPFVKVARYLNSCGYAAPALLAQDEAQGLLLLEDLGDDSFTAVLAGRSPLTGFSESELYREAARLLVRLHDRGATPEVTLPAYNTSLFLTEVSLFTDWYLPQVKGPEKAGELREEYLALWREILDSTPWGAPQFVHRDFHADNLMWLPRREGVARVGLLDFQDAVLGPAAYDLVSFLEDARRDVAPATVEAVLADYIRATGSDEASLRQAYAVLGAQRNSKIIGIFTRLAVRDNKHHYLAFCPRVWRHLEHDLVHPALAKLKAWLAREILPEFRGEIAITWRP